MDLKERLKWIVIALLATNVLDLLFLATSPEPLFYNLFKMGTNSIYYVVVLYVSFFSHREF